MHSEKIKAFDSAAMYAGKRIRQQLLKIDDDIKLQTQEIRVRCSKPVMLCGLYGSAFLFEGGRIGFIYSQSAITASITDIQEAFSAVCSYSVHTYKDSICSGYVTVGSGHRVGIVGTAVRDCERVCGVRDVSGINIRIAREFVGAANGLYELIKEKKITSLIIAGPPSCGKTTLLRDLARLISSQEGGYSKTVIVDEREEIAACSGSVAHNNTGINCDVLSSYPKRLGIQIALRSLAPENIIVDEIGNMQEVEAIEEGLNSGVNFFVTAHAASVEDLTRRPQIRRLIDSGAFEWVVLLYGREKPSCIRRMISAGELIDKDNRSGGAFSVNCHDGTLYEN